jgi:hypothetical protein
VTDGNQADGRDQVVSLDLDAATDEAVEAILGARERFRGWVERIRPREGPRGRFHWAIEHTRDASIPSTGYALGAMAMMGVFDEIITDDDRREGIDWIMSRYAGDGQFRDPALLDRISPDWPKDKPWPSPAMRESSNGYAYASLTRYGADDIPVRQPAKGLLASDGWEGMLEFITTRDIDASPWGEGSHAGRMCLYLVREYREGKAPLEAIVEAAEFLLGKQDPATGTWGRPDLPLHQRLNGAYKLFGFLRCTLDLPLPHADRLLDSGFDYFYEPDHDEQMNSCSEWDALMVMRELQPLTHGHREEELKKLAAHRIVRIVQLAQQADGGFSATPTCCTTSFVGFDMAPPILQGDVHAGIFAQAIGECADILEIQERACIPGMNRQLADEDADLRRAVCDALSRMEVIPDDGGPR